MDLIIVRGANGVVTWAREATGRHSRQWRCSRDSFVIASPEDPSLAEAAAVGLVQHSAGLVGAVQQVLQLDL